MVIDQRPDDDDLERSAAYDEMLRGNFNAAAAADCASVQAGLADVPAAGIIRLLHEVFRAPRVDSAGLDDPLPERVGRFVIERLLGRGAFGRVYLAHDPILRRQIALKVFHEHLLADESTRRHVLREREIMARLQHPHIVPVWEAGEVDNLLYIASEYCPGPTLAQWLAQRDERSAESGRAELVSPANWQQSADWISRLADAVQHSHERGIAHRDLKPGNVLLEPVGPEPAEGSPEQRRPEQWRPRLTDFGLAKYFEGAADETRSGLFIGSLEYASPEQVRGQSQAVGPASDVYSLGVLLYELLTDHLPHSAGSDYELARKICERDVVFSAQQRRVLPRDLQAIALRALERDPRNRYATAADMRDDLQRYLSGEFVSARQVSMLERGVRCARKNPDVAALSGLCVCYALLLGTVLFRSNQQLAVHSTELQQALVDIREQHREAESQRATAHLLRERAEDSDRRAREVGYLANMRLAYEAWEKRNFVDAVQLLEHTAALAPSLRGPDWYLLHRELAARYQRFPHMKEAVYALTHEPAVNSFLAVTEAGSVLRIDSQSQRQTEKFQTSGGVHALAIAPDGQTLAVGHRIDSPAEANALSLWDLPSGKLRQADMHHHETTLESIEYSPDGKWLASGPRYEPVIVTNLETGQSFAIPSTRRNSQIAFSSASDRLAVNVDASTIEVYDLASQQKRITINTGMPRVSSFTWLPTRELIAANFFNSSVQLYSTRSGELVATFPTPQVGEALAASGDGSRLVLGSTEGRLKVFEIPDSIGKPNAAAADQDVNQDAATQVGIRRKPRSVHAIGSVPAFSSSNSLQILSGVVTDVEFVSASKLAASDEEGNLACLDLAAHAFHRFRRKEAYWTGARWDSEDSLTIFGRQQRPERRSLKKERLTRATFAVRMPVDFVQSPDGKLRAVYNQSGALAVMDTETDQPRFMVRPDQGNATGRDDFVTLAVAFTADNSLVVATGENNRLTAWKTADGSLAWEQLLTNTGRTIAEDPATGRLFVGGNFETLRVYESRSGKLLEEHAGGNGTVALVIDSPGGRIISGHCDGTLRIRDLALSSKGTIHRGHGEELTAVALSSDGRSIITGDADGIIRVWHADGQLLGMIYRSGLLESKVQKLIWSPNGSQLAAVIAGSGSASDLVCWQVGPN